MNRRWWLAVALAVAGGLVGYGYGALAHPTYVAKAYVVVVAQDPTDTTSAVNYAQAYARIMSQSDVVDAAARASGGRVAAAQLRTRVQAASSPDAPVIEVSAAAGTAPRSAELANLMANSLVTTGNRQSSTTRVKLALLSAAGPPGAPASPRTVLDIAVGAAVGSLLGGLVALTGTGTPEAPPAPVPVRTTPERIARAGRRHNRARKAGAGA